MKIIGSLFLIAMLLGCNLRPPAATPTPSLPAPQVILTEVLQKLDRCMSDNGVEAGDNTYSFFCRNSADTGYTVTMTRYESEAAAKTQFEADQGENPVSCFHGYSAYAASSKNPYNRYVVQQQFGWLAGQWLISISASYDYGYYHFTTADFSEEIYTSGVEDGLFAVASCP
ncbi:MAG: hypothetical protein ACYCZF_13135 [Anaerolineae bacterium]